MLFQLVRITVKCVRQEASVTPDSVTRHMRGEPRMKSVTVRKSLNSFLPYSYVLRTNLQDLEVKRPGGPELVCLSFHGVMRDSVGLHCTSAQLRRTKLRPP